ncbi:MarR family winged helix-turn-helix transcriptional regulator [Priestia koreensis]|uniref:MarR family winged helix-turn-helix transcriptional regulator n=1 Tax=Priestia koreensis TaxID=284581 RepID=UPI00203BB4EF|nr:MarR family transcriptional regulator [Priestia koreensis]MCM3002709.1 MarR family transcriptional regulator [Priestia koreensis]
MVEEKIELAQSVQMSLIAINKKLRPIVDKNLQPYKITGPQFHVMHMIAKEGLTRVTQLADLMNVKPSAITVLMDRLIDRDLVERVHSERDRRVVMVSLSEQGKALLEEMTESHRKLMNHYFTQFSVEELNTFYQLFEKLDDVISNTEID